MVKLPGLTDNSQYINGVTKIHNTVNIVIGETIIEGSGIILAQISPVLRELAIQSPDIFMDEFVDDIEGIRTCLSVVYGGEVNLTTRNIQTIIKFSLIYKIDSLYEISSEWVAENLTMDNLMLFLKISILAGKLGDLGITEICLCYIRDHVKDELVNISDNWQHEDKDIIKVLTQEEILEYVLPVLICWIKGDADIVTLLDEAEIKGLTKDLFIQGQGSTKLVTIMSEKVELLATSKRVMKLSSVAQEKVTGSASGIDGHVAEKGGGGRSEALPIPPRAPHGGFGGMAGASLNKIELWIPEQKVYLIIGKSGSKINQIRNQTGASVIVNRNHSRLTNEGRSILVTVSGSVEGCTAAEEMISELITWDNTGGDRERTNNPVTGKDVRARSEVGDAFGGMSSASEDEVEKLIPLNKYSLLAGNDGSRISEIQAQTATRVTASVIGSSCQCLVTVSGSAEGCADAMEIIDELLHPDRVSQRLIIMWVETSKLGRVIGKRGCHIREIKSIYGVRVDIKKGEVMGNETKVALTGSYRATLDAKDFIYDLVDAE